MGNLCDIRVSSVRRLVRCQLPQHAHTYIVTTHLARGVSAAEQQRLHHHVQNRVKVRRLVRRKLPQQRKGRLAHVLRRVLGGGQRGKQHLCCVQGFARKFARCQRMLFRRYKATTDTTPVLMSNCVQKWINRKDQPSPC